MRGGRGKKREREELIRREDGRGEERRRTQGREGTLNSKKGRKRYGREAKSDKSLNVERVIVNL